MDGERNIADESDKLKQWEKPPRWTTEDEVDWVRHIGEAGQDGSRIELVGKALANKKIGMLRDYIAMSGQRDWGLMDRDDCLGVARRLLAYYRGEGVAI